MSFFTRVTFKGVKIEENWKKLKNFQLVRPLTVEQQIERFTTAGKELDKLRGLGVYDFNENQPLDDELDDITRDPDFDNIDAAVAARDLALKQQAQAAEDASKPVQEPVEEVLTRPNEQGSGAKNQQPKSESED